MVETNVKGDVKNILIVTQEEIKSMQHFPLELSRLYDPRASRDYQDRIKKSKQEN